MGVPRFAEVEAAVWKSVSAAIERKVDLYIFLGDLTDPDSGGATFRAQALSIRVARKLQEHGISSFWVAGNHDTAEDSSGATTLTPLAALDDRDPEKKLVLPGIFVFEKPQVQHFGGYAFLVLPFTPASHGVDLNEFIERMWPTGEHVVVLSHLSVPGVTPGEETKELPRGREVAYPFEATKNAYMRIQGHYHRRQDFDPQDGGPPIIIPGSLARLTFGEEEHAPSYLYVELP